MTWPSPPPQPAYLVDTPGLCAARRAALEHEAKFCACHHRRSDHTAPGCTNPGCDCVRPHPTPR